MINFAQGKLQNLYIFFWEFFIRKL